MNLLALNAAVEAARAGKASAVPVIMSEQNITIKTLDYENPL